MTLESNSRDVQTEFEGTEKMNRKTIFMAAGAAVLVPLGLFLQTFSASPLPKPNPYTGPLPPAKPPKELAVFSVMTGVNHRVARTAIAEAPCSKGGIFR
jgi:hypothetical protein